MGSKKTQTTTRQFKTFDPFSQLRVGEGQRAQFGQKVFGATERGLEDLTNISGGRFLGNRSPEAVLGLLGGGGGGRGRGRGGGGGGGGGLIGGIMGLGPEALALKRDPFDDPFINKVFGQGTEVARGQHAIAQQNLADMLTRKGVSGPAALALRGQLESQAASQQAQLAEQRALGLGQERLTNIRQLAEHETGLRGISRGAMAQERSAVAGLRGARAAASASRANAAMAARAGLLGQMLGQSGGAAGTLGTGGALRGISAPFDIKTSREQNVLKSSPGIGGILGAGLGAAGSVIGGPIGGAIGFGGGKGAKKTPVPATNLPPFQFSAVNRP